MGGGRPACAGCPLFFRHCRHRAATGHGSPLTAGTFVAAMRGPRELSPGIKNHKRLMRATPRPRFGAGPGQPGALRAHRGTGQRGMLRNHAPTHARDASANRYAGRASGLKANGTWQTHARRLEHATPWPRAGATGRGLLNNHTPARARCASAARRRRLLCKTC